MRVEQPYKIWPGFFPASFCDDIVVLGDTLQSMPATVSHDPAGKARSSEVAWISDTEDHAWIYRPLADLVAVTNRKFWRWHISDHETLQYTRYGEGQFYGWHMDARKAPYPEGERWGGLVRKISVTINLGGLADFEGGTFEIEHTVPTPERQERRIEKLNELGQKGSAVVFPAHLHHRVRPVTRGLRRSLVGWFLGPPFV